MNFQLAEQVQNDDCKKALVELLYQLADDDFITAFRGTEWLGLCPHIEEDVAFSSINQNTMGHAAMFFQLLEELGEGNADTLAHARTANERKNAIILEEVNGPGTYLDEPRFDWAFTVVRNYLYEVYKSIRIQSLKQSSYQPLANVAKSISGEHFYHLMHWDVWFKQLFSSTDEAKKRMTLQLERVWEEFGGVLSFGPEEKQMVEFGFIESEEQLTSRWLEKIDSVFNELNIPMPASKPTMNKGNGRCGVHTEELTTAIETLAEVYNVDRLAVW
ncbi:1,2-phenylacetyl-CoA epoxidase subunit PaaC [Alkalihalobacillus sp. LMS39]|uniref:1,2-phenylacetyl-CoA epoxidase subunit PaaC n=1 Tax=Alkalihalobacillus sp. LMS39 TaxID=2924032 RepID=UPI001FB2657D|nr:1,2-phenylacetyl-CoA epoxidase subunit PaaC [Alkalihalobacillus sp. LMS39]UOE92465.1 phenylacetate-CoA oxygenase subunit PaaC [Alkalihalobacillus sp. LMS39]